MHCLKIALLRETVTVKWHFNQVQKMNIKL